MYKSCEARKKISMVVFFIMVFVMSFVEESFSQSSLSHGHRLLIENGMQFNVLTIPKHFRDDLGNPVNLDISLWYQANFTTADLHQDYFGYDHYDAMTYYGMPAGEDAVPFKVWVADSDGGVCSSQYLDKLRAVQLGDEQSILDPSVLPGFASEVAILKEKYPNAIIHLNQDASGSGMSVSNGLSLDILKNYMQTVKPDMLNFTEYPFRWQGTLYPAQDYEGGSPTGMYVRMELYRQAGLAGVDGTGSQPIPVGMYTEAFTSPFNPSSNHRQPTESEYRLQQFAGLAFGMKSFDSFIYNYVVVDELDSIYFEGNTQVPTLEFYKIAEMNRQARNLAPALVRLISTDVRMKMGQREDTLVNPIPADAASQVAIQAWDSNANSYLKTISATNLGSLNNGKPGDVIVGFLKPIDASLAQPGYEEDEYFMIVNGLTDEAGSAEDCRQSIHLGFDFGTSGINQLLRLSRDTGQVETVTLNHDSGSLYSLDLVLDGGTGDLFKFDNGGDFIGPESPSVHYIFKETQPGTWEVLVEVSGDTAGLSAYEIWVDGVDSSTVSFTENTLGTVIGDNYSPVGFLSNTLLQGDVNGSFNAGNFQGCGENAIEGIGKESVYEEGSDPGATPLVDLDAKALLGILSTEAGLNEENFRVTTAGLLNYSGGGFVDANQLVPTLEVIPFALLPGDANGDGVVSAGDYASVQANFGNVGEPGLPGDANGDGVVSAGDYAAVQANFGNTASGMDTIPEPATFAAFIMGGLVLIRKKNRHG